MEFRLEINPSDKTPLYKQMVSRFEAAIHSGALPGGKMLPSMNSLADSTGISKETVKKVYGILREKGLVVPKQGKGFYVAGREGNRKPAVLVIFDKFSVYKQTIYNALSETFAGKADLTILTHNQSTALLKYYLDNYLDEYDYYLVAPHFAQDPETTAAAVKLLSRIPNRKLIMLDRLLPGYSGNYGAVYQDFENDIYYGLTEGLDSIRTAGRLKVITLPTSLYGPSIIKGVERFCEEHGIAVEYFRDVPEEIGRGDIFLVLNSQLDSGLAGLARAVKERSFSVGKDVKILAYNDFELNEVVLGGLSTVSTDFDQMGRLAAKMILDGKLSKIHCDFSLVRRSTF